MRLQIKSRLFSFLGRESPRELKRLIGLSVFVGITNTAIIGLINAAAAEVTAGESVTLEFFAFAILLVLLLLVSRRSNEENIRSTQDMIYRFKIIIDRFFI